MKQAIFLLFILSFSFATANDTGKNPEKNKAVSTSEFSNRTTSEADLEALDFTVDTIFKNVTFKAADKINYINIYDETHQQIFSATGSALKYDTLNISFLDKGTYYIEVVVNDTIGAKRVII